MLGISIFLGDSDFEKQRKYIEKMNLIGCKQIFTSLHIPEEDHAVYKERLKKLGELASKYQMELFADISTRSLQYLGFSWEKAEGLREWGLTGLRIDYGISDHIIVELSKKMKVALNASTLTQENLGHLKILGLNFSSVEAWHNYYPRPETGLSLEDFNEKNKWLKEQGLKVMAFIPGDGEKRGPLFEGLPTLEKHRIQSTFACFLDLENNLWVDKIFIGDPSINEDSYQKFLAYQNDAILLRANYLLKDESLKERLTVTQTNRQDAARDVIRSEESRLEKLVGISSPIKPNNTLIRSAGTITVDNEKYGRYEGEIQIVKVDLPADDRVNVIGKVIDEDLPLLSYIKGGQKFRIVWV